MKQFIIILLSLLMSTSGFACPEIEGIFKSEYGSVRFDTRKDGDVFVYSLNGMEFIADGKPHQENSQDLLMSYSWNCHSNKIFLNSTIFQKHLEHIQVGSGVFTLVDEDTLVYDFDVTVYSSKGDPIQAMPGAHVVYKR